MPTYEYQCPEGHEFELFQKMSEKPRAKCPVCGRMASRKISGGAGLVFKGSGFYITDYGKDGKGPRKADAADKADRRTGGPADGADKADRQTSGPADGANKTESKPESAPAKPPKPHKKKASE
jgi:putative FmdB family regulatory protein